MQFLVIAHDYKDRYERRLVVREEHLVGLKKLKDEGHLLGAIAMIDENEKMIGSTLIVDFPTRENLDEYLKTEPYVTNSVWETIEIIIGKVPPMFSAKS